jgi:hypothetical protein
MQVTNDWSKAGYLFINAKQYVNDLGVQCLQTLHELYETQLQADGPRKRAYLKLEWDRQSNQVMIAENQNYFQTAGSNNEDGGKVRQFLQMPIEVLELPLIQKMLRHNLNIVRDYQHLSHYNRLVLGLHFIQYIANEGEASYSSPVGLHLDDEPLVFVHLLELSEQALGGDNLIAQLSNQEIKKVIRLERPMDTLLVNRNCYHAVTPLGSRRGVSKRNIILFTIEPEHTQVMSH